MDHSIDIPEEVIYNIDVQLLYKAIGSLTNEERRLIYELYFGEKTKIEEEIAKIIGKTRQAVNKQKKKILGKLKTLVAKPEKVQQQYI